MNKLLKYIAALLLTSCSFQNNKIINNFYGNYYLVAADESYDCFLSYHIASDGDNYSGIVEATVFAVGNNDKYMIIKQHPRTFPNPCDKTVTNYFILPLKEEMNWRTKNGLIGPLNHEQFNEKTKELNIKNIEFTTIIKEVE